MRKLSPLQCKIIVDKEIWKHWTDEFYVYLQLHQNYFIKGHTMEELANFLDIANRVLETNHKTAYDFFDSRHTVDSLKRANKFRPDPLKKKKMLEEATKSRRIDLQL